jgi:hypothetical protein
VDALNSAGVHVFDYRTPENARRAQALHDFASTLDDNHLVWSEMSIADKYDAQQYFQALMNKLDELGYKFYLASKTYAFGCSDGNPQTGIPIKVAFVSARRLNCTEFLGELPQTLQ